METTVIPEQQQADPLKAKLEQMDEKGALQKYASEHLGITVDKALSLPKMRELIFEVHERIQEAAKESNEQAAKEVATEEDPLVPITFKYIEQPGQSLEFVFDHNRGAKFSKRYTMYDGKKYTVPVSLFNHLRSLVVPNDSYELDPNTGFVTGVNRAVVNRFACEIDLAAMSEKEMIAVQKVLKAQVG